MEVLIIDFGAERLDLLTAAMEKFNIDYVVKKHGFDFYKPSFLDVGGIILSGSLACSFEPNAPDVDLRIFNLGIPILGICYGMQLTVTKFGGKVEKSNSPEFGATKTRFLGGKLFDGLEYSNEYMTHYDMVTIVPEGFTVTAKTDDCPVAALEHDVRNIHLVQFHPEFFASDGDTVILENFLFKICGFDK